MKPLEATSRETTSPLDGGITGVGRHVSEGGVTRPSHAREATGKRDYPPAAIGMTYPLLVLQ